MRHETDAPLLAAVLTPYREHCRYLKSAAVEVTRTHEAETRVSASCDFEIPESCYIDDTGHFNSVEFNICYNQMFYYLVGKAVKDRLLDAFADWTMDDYWSRQLGDFLITDFHSTFKRAMHGHRFSGEIELLDTVSWEGSDLRPAFLALHTACRYWDQDGGNCHGRVKIAITNPPAAGMEATGPAANGAQPATGSLLRHLERLPRSERRGELERAVTAELRTALLMAEDDVLPPHENYFDLGLTSLRIAEVKQRLEEQLDCTISTAVLFSSPTLERLMEHLAEDVLMKIGTGTAARADDPAPGDQAARRSLIQGLLGDIHGA